MTGTVTDRQGREWQASISGQSAMGVSPLQAKGPSDQPDTWLRFESPGQDPVTAPLPPGRWIDDLTDEELVEILTSAQET